MLVQSMNITIKRRKSTHLIFSYHNLLGKVPPVKVLAQGGDYRKASEKRRLDKQFYLSLLLRADVIKRKKIGF